MKKRSKKNNDPAAIQTALDILYNPNPVISKPAIERIEFSFPGSPVPAARARVTKWGTYTPKRYATYKAQLVKALRGEYLAHLPTFPPANTKARSEYLQNTRYTLQADFCLSDRRPVDIDNLCKSLLDALQEAGLLLNDTQVDETHLRKVHASPSPRVVFSLVRR